MRRRTFTSDHLTKPTQRRLDAETTLAHLAIITYAVEPASLRKLVPQRFELDCITTKDRRRRALVSVVPFFDLDFHFVRFPWIQWSFGQTNYRAYVRDSETGEHAVWFFGTALDSMSIVVPRYVWKMPWHKATINFDCEYGQKEGRYRAYRMTTSSRWAPATLELQDTGISLDRLDGFPDLETALVMLTHPLRGYFRRRDGRLGSYGIWHPRLEPTVGRVVAARFPLLDRMGLVAQGDIGDVHSVLLQERIQFTIGLPPQTLSQSCTS